MRIVMPHSEYVDFDDDMLPWITEAIDMSLAEHGDNVMRTGTPIFLKAVDHVEDAWGNRIDISCWQFEVPSIYVG